jgi:DNA-binding NarL/FixJ family response regulator
VIAVPLTNSAHDDLAPADAAISAEQLRRLPTAFRRLCSSASVGELFRAAAELVRVELGFDRAVVLSVGDTQLTAGETDPLEDAASDRLRRQVLASPIALRSNTTEAELIRRLDAYADPRLAAHSAVAEELELEHFVFGVIAPEAQALGLLVLDRADGEIRRSERAAVVAFSGMLAIALEHVVLRARVREIASELRYLSTSAQALMAEVAESPVRLPSHFGRDAAFARVDVATAPSPERDASELLTKREGQIASMLVRGLSNREIAGELMLSPETVKANVARILRKLGASNRAEAVACYLRLAPAAPAR